MSPQPSPGPSAAPAQTPAPSSGTAVSHYRDANGMPIPADPNTQIYRDTGAILHPFSATSSIQRTRSRYQSGVAAGAEDVKYAAKYKELKLKVKDIEADNDKLIFKVLQAKRNIQRAKLERAILYERLGQLPASPPAANAPLPPPQVPQQAQARQQHADVHTYPQPGRRHRAQPAPNTHHSQHPHQQPIQPAPPAHVTPPQHHVQAHHGYHPVHDAAHPGQLPITHAQQVCTMRTPEGHNVVVVAGPDGQPVFTDDGRVILAHDSHAPHPPPPASAPRRRGGRMSKETRERHDREEHERRQAYLANTNASLSQSQGGTHLEPQRSSSSSRSHSMNMQGVSSPIPLQVSGMPQIAPMGNRERRERDIEMQRESEHDREMHDLEMKKRREKLAHDDREQPLPHSQGHTQGHHHSHSSHAHAHGHRYHPHQTSERGGSPPPNDAKTAMGHSHRYPNHSHAPRAPYTPSHVHHGHGHHSHSGSPQSPGGYPQAHVHAHQRVGPGSYVIRDATTAGDKRDAPPSAPHEEEAPPAPTASSSRVPTPPYMQRPFRSEPFSNNSNSNSNNNNHTATGDDTGPSRKTDGHPSEEGSGATTPT